MHDRLTGVPPTDAVLDAMTTMITNGDPEGAALLAMQSPYFYNTTLRTWVTPWTNEAQTVYAPLNDFTATVIGMIRDDVPFNEVLTADLVYTGAAGVVGTAYAHTNNDHYAALEAAGVDLSDPAMLVPRAQSTLPGAQIDTANTAGIITTRAAGEAFFSAGTNRAMWRFVSIAFLCRDMDALNDITRPADRVRQDVTRSPGGDSRIYHNTCVGCHAGMDALSGAFAHFEFDENLGRTIFTPNLVQPKNLINGTTFDGGWVTTDDSWENLWRWGQNATLGWDPNLPGMGNGPKSLGEEIAHTRAFAQCKVQQAFEHVCLRPPSSSADQTAVETIATTFEGGYDMKLVFAQVAAHCRAD